MSATHARFENQSVTIEAIRDGSNLTITSPINETGYMTNLQEQVQAWQPQIRNSQGLSVPIATHAELNNHEVVLELTPESGDLTQVQLQAMAEQLGRYLGSRTGRTMSASATGTTTSEEDYETMRGT